MLKSNHSPSSPRLSAVTGAGALENEQGTQEEAQVAVEVEAIVTAAASPSSSSPPSSSRTHTSQATPSTILAHSPFSTTTSSATASSSPSSSSSMFSHFYSLFYKGTPGEPPRSPPRSTIFHSAEGEKSDVEDKGKRRRLSFGADGSFDGLTAWRTTSFSAFSTADLLTSPCLPEECLTEIVSFLEPSDLWPTCAVICRKFSHNPIVVPALLAACPQKDRFQALMSFTQATMVSENDQTYERQDPDCYAPCEKLMVLEIPRLHIGDKGGRYLAKAFRQRALPGLRSMCLNGNGMGPSTLKALADSFISPSIPSEEQKEAEAILPSAATNNQQGHPAAALETFCFSHNAVGNRGMEYLGRAIRLGALPNLQVLQVANSGIHEAGIASVSWALSSGHCPLLRSIDLTSNKIGSSGALLLMYGLRDGKCTKLEELKLANTDIRTIGAQALGDALKNGTLASLSLLDLTGNHIEHTGLEALAKAWADPECHQSLQRRQTSLVPSRMQRKQQQQQQQSCTNRQVVLPLQTLLLGRNQVSDLGLCHLASVFAVGLFANVKCLDLSSNLISSNGGAALFSAIRQADRVHQLKELILGGNLLGAEGVQALATCSQKGVLLNLQRLDLHGNLIGEMGGNFLREALNLTATCPSGCWPKLSMLGLGDNLMGDEGCSALAEAFQNGASPDLTSLDLSGNEICDSGALRLAVAIGAGALSNLKTLEMFGNKIQSDGLRRLAVSFRNHCHSLEVLDLGRPANGPVGIQALGAYFLAAVLSEGAFPSLKALHLQGNGIGRSGVYMLHIAIRNGACTTLESLDLDSNLIADVGGGYLAIAFRRGGCPMLKKLNLSNCGISDTGLSQLAHAFVHRPHNMRLIESFNFANNGVGPHGIKQLCEQIQAGAFPHLLHLNLSRNGIGNLGLEALGHVIESGAMDKLLSLQLSRGGIDDEGIICFASALLTRLRPQQQQGGETGHHPLALRALGLANNNLSGLGVAKLSEALIAGCLPGLEELNLQACTIGNYGALQLSRMLKSKCCVALRDLDLANNRMDHDGISAIATVLLLMEEGSSNDGEGEHGRRGSSTICLRRLAFEGNRFEDETRVMLQDLLKSDKCPLLTHVGI